MDSHEKVPLDDPRWLGVLVAEASDESGIVPRSRRSSDVGLEIQDRLWSSGVLLGNGPAETRVETPSEAGAAFVQLIRFELRLAAAVLRGASKQVPEPARVRWQLGGLVAAVSGEHGVAAVFDEAGREGASISTEEEARLLEVAGAQVLRRGYLLGNPPDGLPLHAGLAAIDARAFVRIAAAQALHGGLLRPRADAYAARLSSLKAAFVELLAGLFAATDPPDTAAEWLRVAARQVRSLSLKPQDRRDCLERLRAPRAAADLLRAAPPRTRRLLMEQLVLAALLTQRWSPEMRARLVGSASEAGLAVRQIEQAEACGAALLVEHRASALALALARPEHETGLEHVLHQTMDSFHDTSDAVAAEIRQAGELGVLLTRMARGETLSTEEKQKMRHQLVDLAKVVPSLAIFAAPGGMLLLPLVFKLLPFDLRPSAFQHRPHVSTPPPVRKRPSDAA